MEYFKYLNPQRIDVLRDLNIRYSQALVFNDPFEAFPAIVDKGQNWYFQHFLKLMELEMKSMVFKSPLEEQNFINTCKKGFPDFYTYCSDGGRQLTQAFSIVMSDALIHGYLSLSKTSQNILMWSHYAQNHEGFVLGFDSGHEYFQNGVSEVRYSDQRPCLNPFQQQQDASLFFTKSTDWAYEQEVRKSMLFPENAHLVQPESLPKSNDKVYESVKLFSYPKSAISSVIFGWKSTHELRNSIIDILEGHGLSSVTVKLTAPHPSEFKIEHHAIQTV